MQNKGDSTRGARVTNSAAEHVGSAAQNAPNPEAHAIVRLKILLVDDDENCLESVRTLLSLDGHFIFTATHGREAVEWARRLRKERAHLDLSILDYHMPDLTGLETFERILAELPDVQGIFISGEPSHTLETQVVQAGGRALVRKPVDLPLIRGLIREVGSAREIN